MPKRKVTRPIIAAVIVLIAINGLFIWRLRERQVLGANFIKISDTDAAVEEVYDALQEMESSQRGYILTGEEKYLEPYRRSIKELDNRFTRLSELDNGTQIQKLYVLSQSKLQELEYTIDIYRTAGRESALKIIKGDRGKNLMDEIRAIVQQKRVESQKKRLNLLEDRSFAERKDWTIATVAFAASGVLLVASRKALFSEMGDRERLAEQMQTERDTAQAISEARRGIIAVMSHELQTPLAVIKAAARNIEVMPSRTSKYLPSIISAVDGLSQLIGELLDMNKAEVGELKINPQEVQIDEFIARVVADFPEQVIEVMISPDIGTVFFDADKIGERVLKNLLSNAAKYGKGDRIQLRVTRYCEPERLVFHITDYGIGILPEDMPCLFEPFHRGSNTGKIKGTGLGLAIAKRIVELHGGGIEVNSVVNVVTTFTVTLPQ